MTEDVRVITVNATEVGERLDQYLARKVLTLSRTRLKNLIADQSVLVNDQPVKPSYRVRSGDIIEIELPPPPVLELIPEPLPLDIVYEDDDLIVINKPAGMVVHPGAGVNRGTLANALAYYFQQLPRAGGGIRPGIVHRLDKETSGLMVVAKSDLAHERLAEQLQHRQVQKLYQALVIGQVGPVGHRGRVDQPIGRHPRHRTMMAVRPRGKGREALTLYRVVELIGEFSLLEIEIKTGRTHQIRVHMAWLGFPVVGDAVYGRDRLTRIKSPEVRRAVDALGRHFLHATRLHFAHPRTGAPLEFASPLPRELETFLAYLREHACSRPQVVPGMRT
ncbi:MAG TPA: RluA family pseudouridine synthase [Blastocatellia bacterium]|nr:RluA family pseudouridine synthase [Blastocatellia bacterium]